MQENESCNREAAWAAASGGKHTDLEMELKLLDTISGSDAHHK